MSDQLADLKEIGWAWFEPSLHPDPCIILANLGPIIPSRRQSADYHDIRVYRREDAPPFSMSAIIGTGPQPMHTDGAHLPEPPRHIALQCINPGEAPCPTHVWSLDFERLSSKMPDFLTRPMWIARSGGTSSPFYCAILDRIHCQLRVRFDACCMAPIGGRAASFQEAEEELNVYARRYDFEWQKGALLIIDNWRCLHARGVGAHISPSRLLRRWTIGVP
jgi:hypothetical protein